MAVAAAIYVGGGIGMEIIVAESMEMCGVALFIRTLAKFLQARIGSLTSQFDIKTIESHDELMRDVESAERRKRERRAG